jgi:diguanylate cyclase (GGDEF)-like protein
MKILVLNGDPTDRSTILQILQNHKHEAFTCENSQAAWNHLQQDHVRFIIADRTNTDVDEKRFIEHIRAGGLPAPVYILLITNRAFDPERQPAHADDYLYKPISAADLRSRIGIGERILSLGDNLLQAKNQLENLAVYDPLTSLLNRKAFLTAAYGELERARRSQSPLSLIMLGMDNFRSLNEQFGGRLGDDVIKLAAQVIRDKCRPYDCLGRWDRDEFIGALADMIASDAEKVAWRIINGARSITLTAGREGSPFSLQMSAGVATLMRVSPTMNLQDMAQDARNAMLRARESGGNQVFLSYL